MGGTTAALTTWPHRQGRTLRHSRRPGQGSKSPPSSGPGSTHDGAGPGADPHPCRDPGRMPAP
eukprot:7185666-Heterocapsa_arctica.AAC.1